MKPTFEELKTDLLAKAKNKHACADQYKRAAKANTETELLVVISDNLAWCVNNECVDQDFFSKFTDEAYYSSGIANSGKENTGYRNTGDSNTGDRNTGSWNTGDSNTGYRNTGDRNTGDSNTGDRNTGDSNTGDRNTGDRNTGSWNTGDRNTGYSNTGDSNTGVFCISEKNPKIEFFNKPSDWTLTDFQNSLAYSLLNNYVDTKLWVPTSEMNDQEKADHKGYQTAGGFYRDIPFKQAFSNAWHNWSEKNRKAFLELPNFDGKIFEEITGVVV